MAEPDYKLIIIPRSIGGYDARLESAEGDLWAEVSQDPQAGDQFRDSLLAFAERFGIPVQVKASLPDNASEWNEAGPPATSPSKRGD